MATLYKQQSKNVQKTWFLMLLFFVLVIALGWFLSWYYGDVSILYIAVIISILMNVWSYWYSDKLVIALTRAKPANRDQYRELWNITENLAISEGLPMPKLYIIDDLSPNAFATGRDRKHAAIAVTTGLLSILDRPELEGVIAHELAHIGNRDTLLQTAVVVLVGLITLVSDFFLRMSLYRKGGDRGGDGRLNLIIMIIGIILIILSPVIATIIQLAISRKREFLADATGALITRYPEGLASALRKISSHGEKFKYANHATAHLFIVNPFGGKVKSKKSFLTNLFMTHPPVEDRISALLGQKQNPENKV